MSKIRYKTLATDENYDIEEPCHPTVRSSTSFCSLLTFEWMNSIFKTGSKRPLNQSDFLPLHENDRTRDLTEQLQKEWNDQVEECNNEATGGKKPKLWKCILRMLPWREIVLLMNFWLMESLFRISQPLVLGLLIHLLSSTEKPDHALVYIFCFLLAMGGLSTACTHYSAYRFELLGMRLSSALKGIIYLKVSLMCFETTAKLITTCIDFLTIFRIFRLVLNKWRMSQWKLFKRERVGNDVQYKNR